MNLCIFSHHKKELIDNTKEFQYVYSCRISKRKAYRVAAEVMNPSKDSNVITVEPNTAYPLRISVRYERGSTSWHIPFRWDILLWQFQLNGKFYHWQSNLTWSWPSPTHPSQNYPKYSNSISNFVFNITVFSSTTALNSCLLSTNVVDESSVVDKSSVPLLC